MKLVSLTNDQLFNPLEATIKFSEYWAESICESKIDCQAGIYIVFSTRYNRKDDTVSSLHRLYIGSSAHISDRIARHPKQKKWTDALHRGKGLFFTFADCANEQRERIESALIFALKPELNAEYSNFFPFGITKVKVIEYDGSSSSHSLGTNDRNVFDKSIKDWRRWKKTRLGEE
jgi:hypothetical protein